MHVVAAHACAADIDIDVAGSRHVTSMMSRVPRTHTHGTLVCITVLFLYVRRRLRVFKPGRYRCVSLDRAGKAWQRIADDSFATHECNIQCHLHRFMDMPRNSARWWGQVRDGYGYGARGTDNSDHFTTPVGDDIDHYTYASRYRGPGRAFDFSPSTETKGFGPVWYGDTNKYGASVGKAGARQPYPVYTDYMTEDAARGAGIHQQYATRNLEMPAGYMKGFAKDFFAYFSPEDRAGEELPDPIAAGYWPYALPDGTLAAGDPGATGQAWRSFAEEDKKSDSGRPATDGHAETDDMDDVDSYLDAESSVYTNDMRFYLNDDWP